MELGRSIVDSCMRKNANVQNKAHSLPNVNHDGHAAFHLIFSHPDNARRSSQDTFRG